VSRAVKSKYYQCLVFTANSSGIYHDKCQLRWHHNHMSHPLIQRALDLRSVLKQKSCFLFGPRQTGKTTLFMNQLGDVPLIQLLDAETQRDLLRSPSKLGDYIPPQSKIAVIDEVQKIPELLDQVHLLIETRKIHFLLTGSNPRKLKRQGVNLLGGRARRRELFPLTWKELGTSFDLEKVLGVGTIPSIFESESPLEDLSAYTSEYLTQEVAAEGITRNVPAFSRFLEVAALSNGQMINYTSIASDAQVARSTVQLHYQILEDTLIGFRLQAWKKGKTRKAIGQDKFYFFDCGVVNSLSGRKSVGLRTVEAGILFETSMLNEVRARSSYQGLDLDLSYWRSKSGFEVDLIINDEEAVEFKCKEVISDKDLRSLQALLDERPIKHLTCVYTGKRAYQVGKIRVLPYAIWLEEFWA
jgi:predicted AAA+ superfamily ATPase